MRSLAANLKVKGLGCGSLWSPAPLCRPGAVLQLRCCWLGLLLTGTGLSSSIAEAVHAHCSGSDWFCKPHAVKSMLGFVSASFMPLPMHIPTHSATNNFAPTCSPAAWR